MNKPSPHPPLPTEPTPKANQEWRTLAERASQEQDPDKFLDLVSELCGVLDERQAQHQNPYLIHRRKTAIQELLQSAIAASGADFGNVQLLNTTDNTLRIVAAHGFDSRFLEFFESVKVADECDCAAAMRDHSRIFVADVARHPSFSTSSREMLQQSSVRSVQSTPLVGSSGRFLGVVSTHYRQPNGPNPGMWKVVDEVVAGFLKQIA
jgi:GAF domain-containing protein